MIEMLHITKEFPGIKANDDVTLQLRRGEVHALLGENGAGKSTLMSVLFGLYQPEHGVIKKNGQEVNIKDPNAANDLGIGMVHQHLSAASCWAWSPARRAFCRRKRRAKKVMELSEKYGLAGGTPMRWSAIFRWGCSSV